MIEENKVLVIDVDGTLCKEKKENEAYSDVVPQSDICNKLNEYKNNGFYIILYTSRNMRTYGGNIGKINVKTSKVLIDWLENYKIPYDELYFGKPWCGKNGFYVDDKSIRPREFAELSYEQINDLIVKDKL